MKHFYTFLGVVNSFYTYYAYSTIREYHSDFDRRLKRIEDIHTGLVDTQRSFSL